MLRAQTRWGFTRMTFVRNLPVRLLSNVQHEHEPESKHCTRLHLASNVGWSYCWIESLPSDSQHLQFWQTLRVGKLNKHLPWNQQYWREVAHFTFLILAQNSLLPTTHSGLRQIKTRAQTWIMLHVSPAKSFCLKAQSSYEKFVDVMKMFLASMCLGPGKLLGLAFISAQSSWHMTCRNLQCTPRLA